MENVTLTQKEQTRLQVLNSQLADHMTTDQTATLMGVSEHHARRLLAAYKKEGAVALAHGNRGRRTANATPDSLATTAADALRGHADTGGRQLPQMVWREWPSVHTAVGGGRRYRDRGQCAVLRVGEHPQLLPTDRGADTGLRHTTRTLSRPPCRHQRPPPVPPSSVELWTSLAYS